MKSASHRWSHLADIVASFVALALFLALHRPITQLFEIGYLGSASGDGGLYVWLSQIFLEDPWRALRLETNAMYPYPLSRAWSDSFLLPSALTAAFFRAGLTFPAAYNTTLLLAIALNCYATARLARAVGLSGPYAIASGVLVANASYFVGNIGHPQLLFFFWIPLAWSLVLPRAATPVPSRRWLLAGACVAAAFYSAVYYAIFAALGLAVIWICSLVWGTISYRNIPRPLLLAALGALPIAGTLPSYLAVQSFFGTRALHETSYFAASGASFVAFSEHNFLFRSLSTLTHPEATLNPGFVVLLLALPFGYRALRARSVLWAITLCVAIAILLTASSVSDRGNAAETITCISAWLALGAATLMAIRRRDASGPLALTLIVVICFVFAFGPGGDPSKHEPAYAPFGFFYSLVPGLGSTRAVGRFGSVVILGLIILSAAACSRFGARFPRARWPILALFVGISLTENFVPKVPIDGITERPAAFNALRDKRQPTEAAIVLPFAGELENGEVKHWSHLANLSVRYAQWSGALDIPIVNGYSGQRSKLHYDLPRAMAEFPDDASLEYLARICGVRWVIIVPHLMPQSLQIEEVTRRLDERRDAITSWDRFPDGSLLIRLAPYPLPISQAPRLFLGPTDSSVVFSGTARDSACMVSIDSLERSAHGDKIRVNLLRADLSPSPTLLTSPRSTTASRAAPGLLELSTSGCAASVTCEAR